MKQVRSSTEQLRPRAADRIRVDFDAYLRFENWPEVPVFIRDFSSRGFKCGCEQTLRIGSRVILRVPQLGQFPATVAWQLGDHAGARFDSPLPLQTVMQILLAVVQPDEEERPAKAATPKARKAPARARRASA